MFVSSMTYIEQIIFHIICIKILMLRSRYWIGQNTRGKFLRWVFLTFLSLILADTLLMHWKRWQRILMTISIVLKNSCLSFDLFYEFSIRFCQMRAIRKIICWEEIIEETNRNLESRGKNGKWRLILKIHKEFIINC